MEAGNDAADERDVDELMQLASRLKAAVKASGGNERVAERAGVPLRTLTSYLAGAADPKVTKLDRIAAACNTTVDQLLGRKSPNRQIAADDLVTNLYGLRPGERRPQLDPEIPEGFVVVPRLEVRASAGPGRAVVPAETVITPQIAIQERWLRSLGIAPSNAEFLEARGDSMEPTIRDGDLMLVDRGFGEVLDGKIYVLVVSGLVVVKRIQRLAFGGLMLISDNPRYPTETIPRDEVNDLGIEARVAWYGRAI